MELSKDHQAPATLPGLCYVQTARQPTHADKDHAIVSQQLLQRHQPGIHHAEPLIVTGQVLALFAHYFSQPFLDVGIADIIVVAPALVAGVVGRVNLDALHLALILRQQGFQCFKIIAVDDHVLTAVVFGVLPLLIKTVLPLQHPEGNFLMMVHDFIFTDPFQGWHGVFLQFKNFKLRTKRTHCCGKQGIRLYKCYFALQNACWAVPKPHLFCIVPMQAARLFQTLL